MKILSRFPLILTLALVHFSLISAEAADLAKVNGKPIPSQALKSALSHLNEGQRDSFLADINNRRELLWALIDQEVLVTEAERTKLDQSVDYKDAEKNFRRQYLASKILEKSLSSQLTEAAAKQYYERNLRKYSTEQIRVQHILFATEADAQKAYEQASKPNADFLTLAESLSKDPTVKNNRGDIGFISRDAPFVPEFKDAAFGAKVGEVVGPVKTNFGYHLLKVAERKPGKTLNYHEVELRVKNDFKEDLTRLYLAQLKKTTKIQVDEKALARP